MSASRQAKRVKHNTPEQHLPGFVYEEVHDFLPAQLATFEDVWSGLRKLHERAIVDEETFWEFVYRDQWNSTWPVGGVPLLGPRLGTQSMFLVGEWNQDLPSKPGKVQKDARTKGAPAYIKLHVNALKKNPAFAFCDSSGVMGGREHIEFLKGPTNEAYEVGQFINSAMSNYDEIELSRVKEYHNSLARYIIRRRLAYWTKHGWTENTVVPGEAELLGKFEEVKFSRNDERLRGKCLEECAPGMAPEPGDLIPVFLPKRCFFIPREREPTAEELAADPDDA